MSEQTNPRRTFLVVAGLVTASSVFRTAQANESTNEQTSEQASGKANEVAPTTSMRGGSNNYRRGAPIVEKIGGGGFWMTGTVRRAGDGAPLKGQRIQIWAHTTEGHEREAQSHGATLTDTNGDFRLEMPQIVPAFGQAHGHLAYDSDDFETVFLRPVMASPKDQTLSAHFVLTPV